MGRHDQEILDLCRAGDQQAIAAMEEAYGSYCYKVALNILGDHHDAEECVSDAYLAVWNAIPAAEPGNLLAYLAKTTRNIALKRLAYQQAQKRDSGIVLVLDELAEVLPARGTVEDAVAEGLLMQAVNDFLRYKASKVERNLFLRRYFWGTPSPTCGNGLATARARPNPSCTGRGPSSGRIWKRGGCWNHERSL